MEERFRHRHLVLAITAALGATEVAGFGSNSYLDSLSLSPSNKILTSEKLPPTTATSDGNYLDSLELEAPSEGAGAIFKEISDDHYARDNPGEYGGYLENFGKAADHGDDTRGGAQVYRDSMHSPLTNGGATEEATRNNPASQQETNGRSGDNIGKATRVAAATREKCNAQNPYANAQNPYAKQKALQPAIQVPPNPMVASTAGAPLAVEKAGAPADDEDTPTEAQRLMRQVKEAGTAGVVSYALWELGFWALSVPACVAGYHAATGHWPDLAEPEDQKRLGAEAFAFVNVARFAVPLRIGLALGTTPWIDENVVRRFGKAREDDDGGEM